MLKLCGSPFVIGNVDGLSDQTISIEHQNRPPTLPLRLSRARQERAVAAQPFSPTLAGGLCSACQRVPLSRQTSQSGPKFARQRTPEGCVPFVEMLMGMSLNR
jgi:hypothetical protein